MYWMCWGGSAGGPVKMVTTGEINFSDFNTGTEQEKAPLSSGEVAEDSQAQ